MLSPSELRELVTYVSFVVVNVCRRSQWHYVTLVAVAVVVRPTSAIVWVPFCAWHVWHVVASRRLLWKLLSQYIWRR